ncbi:hypothetical protein PFISCL1PPCAC_7066, partial [Pristionchus fissidentatus]
RPFTDSEPYMDSNSTAIPSELSDSTESCDTAESIDISELSDTPDSIAMSESLDLSEFSDDISEPIGDSDSIASMESSGTSGTSGSYESSDASDSVVILDSSGTSETSSGTSESSTTSSSDVESDSSLRLPYRLTSEAVQAWVDQSPNSEPVRMEYSMDMEVVETCYRGCNDELFRTEKFECGVCGGHLERRTLNRALRKMQLQREEEERTRAETGLEDSLLEGRPDCYYECAERRYGENGDWCRECFVWHNITRIDLKNRAEQQSANEDLFETFAPVPNTSLFNILGGYVEAA